MTDMKRVIRKLSMNAHLLSVARLEKGSGVIIPNSDSPRKDAKGSRRFKSGGTLLRNESYLLSTENI